jgi:hypothetical protein
MATKPTILNFLRNPKIRSTSIQLCRNNKGMLLQSYRNTRGSNLEYFHPYCTQDISQLVGIMHDIVTELNKTQN